MPYSLYNFALSFLSRDWAGLALALAVAVLAVWCVRMARAKGAKWPARVGYAVLGVAGLMALGSVYHLAHMARVRVQHPPPGVLVDIGGYRLHVLAEGEARGKPTIVWMPGGHSAGLYLHHLHRMLREEARSILIDRPGSGWSDIGPFPRTTATEAEEVVAALEKSGEKGPFVLVGHSFGGLLVANIARRHPEIVAGVVLLDATPPDTIIYTPPNPGLSGMRRDALVSAIWRLFGIHPDLAQRLWGSDPDPATERFADLIEECLGAALVDDLRAVESGPRNDVAAASIFAELSPVGMASAGWRTVVYDGDLGDLPVFLVAPRDLVEFEEVQKNVSAEAGKSGDPEAIETTRLHRFYSRTRERYLATSSRSERIYTPEGTAHIFAYETPEFVADVVRRMQREHSQPPGVD